MISHQSTIKSKGDKNALWFLLVVVVGGSHTPGIMSGRKIVFSLS